MFAFLFSFWPGARRYGDGRKENLIKAMNHGAHHLVESVTFSLDVTAEAESRTDTWMEVVSWLPRAFVLHNFLTESECDHLIKEAKDKLERSTVISDPSKRDSKVDNVRTSSGTFLTRLMVSMLRNHQFGI
jgi:hypothetical protein